MRNTDKFIAGDRGQKFSGRGMTSLLSTNIMVDKNLSTKQGRGMAGQSVDKNYAPVPGSHAGGVDAYQAWSRYFCPPIDHGLDHGSNVPCIGLGSGFIAPSKFLSTVSTVYQLIINSFSLFQSLAEGNR